MPTISTSGGASTEALLICELPPKTRLDTPWPMRRLCIEGMPHRIAHDTANNVYAVLSARQVSHRPEICNDVYILDRTLVVVSQDLIWCFWVYMCAVHVMLS